MKRLAVRVLQKYCPTRLAQDTVMRFVVAYGEELFGARYFL
jgi:hypothetical protein